MACSNKPFLRALRIDERLKRKGVCKECSICSDLFDEDEHCPRLLPCSHCVCNFCLSEIITTSKSCPFCRAEIEEDKAENLPKNISLLDILKYVSMLESLIFTRGDENKPPAVSFARYRNDLRNVSRESCSKTQDAIEEIQRNMARNSGLLKGMTNQNEKISKVAIPRLKPIEERNTNWMEYLAMENIKLKSQLDIITHKEKQMQDADAGLKAAKNFSEAAPFLDLVENTDKELQDLVEDLDDFLVGDNEGFQKINEAFQKIDGKVNAFMQILTSIENEPEFKPPSTKVFMTMQQGPQYLTVDDLQKMERPIKRRARHGKIFTVDKSLQQSALVSLSDDGRICVHCLKKDDLPANSCVVMHEDIMQVVDASSKLVFFELGALGNPLGRLYINLFPNYKTEHPFFLLATGQNESSFVDARIVKVLDKGVLDKERILFRVNTGKDFPKWSDFSMDVQECPEIPSGGGVIEAAETDEDGIQFTIRTLGRLGEPSDNDLYSKCIGKVEEGLSVLSTALAEYEDVTQVSVTNCGIILPKQPSVKPFPMQTEENS